MQACRRISPRSPIEFPVTLISSHYPQTRIDAGKTSNLSEGGLAVVTKAALTAHQSLWLEFKLPARNQAMQLQAIVRHCSGDCYGLEFLFATRDQRAQIQNLIGEA